METDTLEQRVMKSNLSNDDKIEIIKKLNESREYVYIPGTTWPSEPRFIPAICPTYTTITCG